MRTGACTNSHVTLPFEDLFIQGQQMFLIQTHMLLLLLELLLLLLLLLYVFYHVPIGGREAPTL